MNVPQASLMILLGSASASRLLQSENGTITGVPTEPSTGTAVSNGDSSTLIFNNGDQNALDPNQVSTSTNIEVTDSSTLFITNDSIGVNGYCDGCIIPNATISVSETSNLIIGGSDIKIFGSNQGGVINDAGGSAIELKSTSKGRISGSVVIRGGDGDATAGVGGDALGLYDESYVEIGGDIILQGGEGVENGKAITVDTGSTAVINSGTFEGAVWVENGKISVFGGTFEDGVTLKGEEASATFHGCFAVSKQRTDTNNNVYQLSGQFFNSTELESIATVDLYDGASLFIDGGGDCPNSTISGNTTNISDGTDDSVTSYPTYMPTSFRDENENGCGKATSSLMVVAGLVLSQHAFNVF